MNSSASAKRSRRITDGVAICLFFVAATALIAQAGDPFWLDELHSVWTAQAPPGEIVERATLGNQSPPFFLAEAIVGRCFGYGPVAMRTLSALSGAAALSLAFRDVARRADSLVAAGCVWLAQLTWPNLTFYFVEARPYGMVFLGATLAWIGIAEALSPSTSESNDHEDASATKRRLRLARPAWIGGLTLAVWLHPTAILMLPAATAILLLWPRANGVGEYDLRKRILDLGFVAFGCLLQAPLWLAVYGRRGAWNAFIRDPTWRDLLFDFDLLAFVVLPLAFASLAYALRTWYGDRQHARRFALAAIFAFAFAGTVAIACIVTWTDVARLYHFRYLIGAAAALPLFAGATLARVENRRTVRIVAVALLATSFWATGGWATLRTTGRIVPPRSEDWASLAARLSETPNGPIVLDADVIESVSWADSDQPERREYLAFPLRAFDDLRDRHVQSISYRSVDTVELTPETVELTQRSGRLYAVIRGGERAPTKMARRMSGQLPARFDATPRIESFGRVWLLTYSRQE